MLAISCLVQIEMKRRVGGAYLPLQCAGLQCEICRVMRCQAKNYIEEETLGDMDDAGPVGGRNEAAE